MSKWIVILSLIICIFALTFEIGGIDKRVKKYRVDFHECALKVYYLEKEAGKNPYWPFNTNTKTREFDYLTKYAKD